MTEAPREIVLRLSGPSVVDQRVSLVTLARKLDALQQTVLAFGNYYADQKNRKRSEVRQQCELFFVKTSHGSLLVVAELPTGKQIDFIQEDIGQVALTSLKAGLEAAKSKEPEQAFQKLIPDAINREKIVRSVMNLCPQQDDDYSVEISVGKRNGRYSLDPQIRSRLLSVFTKPAKVRVRKGTLTGRLVEVLIIKEQHIGLQRRNKIIPCYYSGAMEDFIRQNLGSLVTVSGPVDHDKKGNIRNLVVEDIQPIDLRPLRINEVEYSGRIFKLTETISCDVDFHDDLWFIICKPLGITAYGSTRHEALMDFGEWFAALYEEYALADDSELATDAVRLKYQLRYLVEQREWQPSK
jgi:hypothetical protein